MSAGAVLLLTSSTIVGTVTFQGRPPARQPVNMSADPACEALHPVAADSGAVVVGPGGGLANAFVWLKSGVTAAPADPAVPPAPVVLDQVGCEFVPHVLGLRPGQAVVLRNSDDTLHNIHPRPGRGAPNQEFNIAQARRGMEAERRFS